MVLLSLFPAPRLQTILGLIVLQMVGLGLAI